MTALALALVLAAAPAAPGGRDVPVEIAESGSVSFEPGSGRWLLDGGAVLKRGDVTLRAASARYDPRTGEIDAVGGVLLVQPGRALSAERVHAVIDGPFEARDVVAFTKEGPLDLSRCATVDEARASGRNRVTFRGARVAGRSGDPSLEVDGPRVTLCDCGAGPPSWEIRASRGDVVPGRRAWLTWPVVWITPRFLLIDRPLPVLALPALYVPLAERQSGLLLPALSFGGPTSFAFSQPLFLAPAEWWDATISYDQAFGSAVAKAGSRSVRGAGSTLELRWAPAEATAGRLRLSWLHDVARDAPGLAPHGERVALSLVHDERLGARTALHVDAGLLGDAAYVADFTSDVLLRAAEYRRSSAWVAHAREDAVLSLDAAYLQPLLNVGGVRYGAFGGEVPVLHRLPALTATLLPVPLAGPVRVAGQASVARFAPLAGRLGDEGVDGVGPGGRGWPGVPDAGERDGRFEPGERVAGTRAAARLELRAPVPLAGAAVLEPWAAGTATGYAYDAGAGPRGDARLAGGVALSTRLTRAFGALRHDVEPRLEWRAGVARSGLLPAPAYDELDPRGVGRESLASAPAGGFQQATLSVRNRLHAGPATALDLTLGQDADLDRRRLAEAFAELRLAAGPLAASVEARAHPDGAPIPGVRAHGIDLFSLLRASAAVSDRRGDQLRASIVSVGPGGSERLAAGLGPILEPRPVAFQPVASGSAGATLRWSGAIVTYDALFNARDLVDVAGNPAPRCSGKTAAPHLYQQVLGLAWDSPCKCFRIGVRAVSGECPGESRVGLELGLGELGGTNLDRSR